MLYYNTIKINKIY